MFYEARLSVAVSKLVTMLEVRSRSVSKPVELPHRTSTYDTSLETETGHRASVNKRKHNVCYSDNYNEK